MLGGRSSSSAGEVVIDTGGLQDTPSETPEIVDEPDDGREAYADLREAEEAADNDCRLAQKSFLLFKRSSDIVLASAGLAVLSPVLLATAIAVKVTSPGPIIFKQLRFGKNKRPFVCYKFRSMRTEAPDNLPTALMNEDKNCLTPIGAFIRKTSLDELPQLVNIIKGDMSVIGPRPMILSEYRQIEMRDAYGANDIQPGLTGLAQVNGRDFVTPGLKARMDGVYRHNLSAHLDAVCFIKSIEVVLSRQGNAADSGVGKSVKKTEPAPLTLPKKRTKILVVSQHYWPEPFNFAEICEELVQRGYDVTVLTGLPNYPEGAIYPGYEGGKNRYQIRNGVRIIRSPLIPRGTSTVQRVVNYFSFSHEATKMTAGLESDFDVVLAFQTSPVMMAEPALAYAKRTGVPVLLWCIDIWPECLTAGGIPAGSAPYNLFKLISKRIYRSADRLAVTSPLFKEYLHDMFGMNTSELIDLPQYAEDLFTDEAEDIPEGYDRTKINLTFAGNIGSAQSVETIIEAARLVKGEERLLFHVVGSGSSEQACRDLAKQYGLNNVVFHGRHPLEEMPAFYQASDAMLATFADNPVLGYTLPRKIQSYLAAGKPIIGTVTGEAARVINEAPCGLTSAPEDPVGFAANCLVFAEQPDSIRAALGRCGKAYYEKHFTKQAFYSRLEKELNDLKGKKHGA